MDLRKNLRKQFMLRKNGDADAPSTFYCTICEIGFNDSISYMDHRNGKKHNRVLGMNMKVRKVGLDAVNKKLELLAQKKKLKKKGRNKLESSIKIKKMGKASTKDPKRYKDSKPKAQTAAKKTPPAPGAMSEGFLKVIKGEMRETELVEELENKKVPCPGSKSQAADDSTDQVDQEELALLRSLGLPVAFKSSKQKK